MYHNKIHDQNKKILNVAYDIDKAVHDKINKDFKQSRETSATVLKSALAGWDAWYILGFL